MLQKAIDTHTLFESQFGNTVKAVIIYSNEKKHATSLKPAKQDFLRFDAYSRLI
jgi:hypothetical protein